MLVRAVRMCSYLSTVLLAARCSVFTVFRPPSCGVGILAHSLTWIFYHLLCCQYGREAAVRRLLKTEVVQSLKLKGGVDRCGFCQHGTVANDFVAAVDLIAT